MAYYINVRYFLLNEIKLRVSGKLLTPDARMDVTRKQERASA
jgi:hypothetical protein